MLETSRLHARLLLPPKGGRRTSTARLFCVRCTAAPVAARCQCSSPTFRGSKRGALQPERLRSSLPSEAQRAQEDAITAPQPTNENGALAGAASVNSTHRQLNAACGPVP